jgi:hypothetical protein
MSTLLNEPEATVRETNDAAQRLRASMVAVRLSFTWFGTRKSLSYQQKSQAADTFGAEGKFLTAGKKLIDTHDPAFRAVTAVRGQATAFFRGISLSFPEQGIRLIRQEDLLRVNDHLDSLREELGQAVIQLDRHYSDLKQAARQRLGSLYDENDYPVSLVGLFDMNWDHPNIEPPNYLRQINPELYEQECQRVQARFNEAVELAESAFTEELSRLVQHLSERLSGQEDGRPKIFRDSAVTNLSEFFERFQRLNIRSSEQLDQLVFRARQVLGGIEPQALRDSTTIRSRVANELAAVESSLEGLLVDRPRRNIIRRPR